MKVLALCGSRRKPSTTRAALSVALDAAQRAGAEIGWLDLSELNLPLCDGRDGDYGPEVTTLRQEIAAADALIVGSPEYHGSMSGGLKNALDLLGPEDLRNKLVALVATARGDAGAMNTLNNLGHVIRWMNAWVLPTQVSVPSAQERMNKGEPDAALRAELERLGRELVRYGGLMLVKSGS